MKLTLEKWHGNINNSYTTEIRHSDAAIAALKALNGHDISQLIVSDDNGFLLIGGGPVSFIVSYIAGDHETSFNLVNIHQADSNKEISLVTGGQSGLFPEKICSDLTETSRALNHYVDTGTMNPAQVWEEE